MKRLKPSANAAESVLNQPLRVNAMAFAVAMALSPALQAQNLPTGLQTVKGAATVTTPTATSMSILQSSQNAGMNAQTFSIGTGYRVDVLQPTKSSVMVMNVVGKDPTSIFGTLTANGNFFLINPAGVLFAPGAIVDVGGIIASTLPISYTDATSGRFVFTNQGNSASVVNQGRITALNGYVGLFAPKVVNEGVIVARMGSVALAAGNQVTLDMVGDGLIKVAVNEAALNASVMNKGTIEADGGNVLLSARSAGALLDTVINTDGVIRANTIANRNGTIVLDGGTTGVVSVSGTLEAKGNDTGTIGGTVKVLGDKIGLFDNASINASGDSGGGTVLVGGNYQGKGPEQNALRTFVGGGATINADAVTTGDGGRVIVWADETTAFLGSITARGGSQSGNGGFAEVSGKQNLLFRGTVDLSSPNGTLGTLLLDPSSLTITDQSSGAGTQDAQLIAGNNILAGDANVGGNTVSETALEGLGATASVILEATGQITVNNLTTDGVLNMAQTGAGSFRMTSTASNGINFQNTANTIQTAGGSITLEALGTGTLTNIGNLTSNNGAISLTSSGGSGTVSGNISAGTGGVAVAGAGNLTISGVVNSTNATSLSKNGAGTLTLSGTNTYTGTTAITAGVLDAKSNAALGTAAGNTTVASGAALQIDGSGLTITEPLSIAGTGVGGAGAVRNLANSNTLTGGVTLTGASRINSDGGTLTISTANITGAGQNLTVGGAGNTTVSSNITTTTGTLTKDGAGTLTLAGANTYTGTTAINAGVIDAKSNAALGTAAGNTTVASGAALQIDGSGLTIAEPLSIAGTGIAGAGAVNNVANSNALTGGITLTGASRIRSASGSLTISTANITGAGQDLTVAGAGNTVVSSNITTTTGTLTKIGAGTLTLSGANTYTGTTTVSGGSLTLSGGAAIANTGAVNLDTSGANLTLSNSETIGSLAGVAGTTVTLNANTLTTGDATNTTYAGVIGGVGGALTKQGTGTFTLSGANTYTGATAINAGVIDVQNDTALGTAAGITTVASGAALQISGSNLVILEPLSISGTGVGGAGAVRNVGITNTLLGGITLTGGASRINSDVDVLGISSFPITGAGQNLTVGGAGNTQVVSSITTGAGTLTKDGSGTLILEGTNTYTGATAVNAGTLAIKTDGALGTAAGNTTVASGATLLLFSPAGLTTAEPLLIAGTGVGGAGAVRNLLGNNALTGGITLTAPSRINSDGDTLTISTANITGAGQSLTVGGAGNTTVSSNITTTTGTLTKDGAGTLTLSGANTYTGATAINAGVLDAQSNAALGTAAGNTTVASGAALQIDGSGLTIAEPLSIAGTGIAGAGAVNNVANSNALTGGITLTGASRIRSASGSLTISTANITGAGQDLTVAGAGNTVVSSNITTTTGTLTKIGAGTLTLSGANTYTGTTTVSGGSLTLSGGAAIANTGAVNLDTSGANLTLSNSETIGSLAGVAGTTVTLNANTLTTGDATNTTYAGVIGGVGGALTKQGTGTFTLSGANTYTGATTINAGVIDVQNNTALGTAAGNTAVASGAALQIDGSGLTIAEPLSIAGTGVSSTGAVRNLANSNTLTGGVALTGASRINSDGGTLTISTANITGAGQNLTVGGAGNTTVSSNITTTTGTLTKDGAGTLTLSGANTYTGTTIVSAGSLVLQNGSAIADTGAVNLSTSGANLTVNNTETIGSLAGVSGTTVTVNGSELTTGDATNTTYAGVIGGAGGFLTKQGAGTFTLTGANTYTGTTSINAGTLALSGSGTLGTAASGTTIAAAGTLDVQGGVTTADALTINGGTLADSTVGAATATVSGTVTLGADSTINVAGTPPTSLLVISGQVTGGFGFAKLGTGVLVLTNGTNNYAGATTINAGPVVVTQNNALGTTAGGTIVNAGGSLSLKDVNYATAEPVTLAGGAIGTSPNSTIGSTFAGPVTLTGDSVVFGSHDLTLSGTVGGAANNLFLNRAGGTLTLSNNVTLGSMSTAAAAYDVSLIGASSAIGGATTFNNTGTVTLGNGGGDIATFSGGVNTTAGSATNVNGTVRTAGVIMSFSPVTLGGASTLDTTNNGASAAGAAISVGAMTTGGNALTLNAGTGGAITGTSFTGGGDLTITNSNGTTFSGPVTVGTLTITDTTDAQTVAFQGNLTVNTGMTVAANGAYNVSLTGATNSIAGATTFGNTGTVTLGNGGDTTTFTGGVTATAPSSTTLNGTVRTAGAAMSFGPVTLGGASTLDSTNNGGVPAGADIGTGVVTGGGFAFTENAGTSGTITNGALNNVGAFTVTNSGALNLNGTIDATSVALTSQGLIDVNQAITTPGTLALTGGSVNVDAQLSGGDNISVYATNTASGDVIVNANIVGTGAAGKTLDIRANNSVLFTSGADVSTTNALNVILNSDRDASGAGAIALGSGTTISSVGGAITLGGGASPLTTAAFGTAANKDGISLDGATLTSGAGAITLTGQGFAGSVNNNNGIVFQNTSVATATSGAITLTGTGGAGGGVSNFGVQIKNDSKVESTGSGAISITGTGVNPTDSQGILLAFGTNTIGGGSATGDILLRSLAGTGIQLGFSGGGDVAANVTTTGNVTLDAAGGAGVTQVSGAITAAGLELQGTGSHTLTSLTNNVATISGNTSGTVKYVDATALTVGTVTTAGFTGAAGNAVKLNTQTGDLLVNQPINTGAAGTVTLQAVAGNVVGNSTGVITAGTLGVNGLAIDLSSANNQVTSAGTVAIKAIGNVVFQNANGYNVNTVAADAPVFSATVDGLSGNDIYLTTNAGTVTQTVAKNVMASGLDLRGASSYTLTNLTNDVTTIAGTTTGTVKYVDANALTVGTVTTAGFTGAAGNTVKLNTQTGDLTVNEAINTGAAGTVTLQSLAGQVQQGAAGVITAGTLGVNAGAAINLAAANNQVASGGTVAMKAAGGGPLAFQNANGYNVDTVAADAPVFSATVDGLNTTNDIKLITHAGTVTQTAAKNITAAGLELQGVGSYTLTNLTNDVTTIAGSTTGTVKYVDATALTVDTVNASFGFTGGAGNTVKLNTQTGDLTVNQPINTGAAGTVTLQALVGQVTQAATGVITAGTLGVNAGTAIDLSAASNAVGSTVAMKAASGNLLFKDTPGYQVNTVAADSPVFSATVDGLSAAGNNITLNQTAGTVTQAAAKNVTAAGLELQGAGSYTLTNLTNDVTTISGNTSGTVKYVDATALTVGTVTTAGFTGAAGNTVKLNTQTGDLTVNQAINTGAAGTVTLQSLAGQVTQAAAGVITAGTLGVNAGTAISLSAANNQVTSAGTVAMNAASGNLAFQNANGYNINTVAADAPVFSGASGLSAVGNNITLTTNAGTVTQTAANTVTASGLELLGAGAYTLTDPGNAVTTIAANTTNAISYRDTDALTVGTVGGTTGINSGGNSVTLQSGTSTTVSAAGIAGNGVTIIAGSDVTTANSINGGAGGVNIQFGQSVAGVFTANVGTTFPGAGTTTVTGGGSGNTFNLNTAITANLVGGAGSDIFNIANPLTGTVDGGSGPTDTLQGAALSNPTLTATGPTHGFSGTITGVSGGFANIDALNASGRLTGANLTAIWTGSGSNAGSYAVGANTLTFSGFSNLTGGTGTDTFNGVSVTGNVDAGTGAATLTGPISAGGTLTSGTGGGTTNTSGNIATGGAQTYTGPVTLTGDTNMVSTGGGTISFGSTVDGASNLVIVTTGNVGLGTGIGQSTPLANLTVAGAVPDLYPSGFLDPAQIPFVNTLTMTNISASSPTTGMVVLSANSFTGTGTVTTGTLSINSESAPPAPNSITLFASNLNVSGAVGTWVFGGSLPSGTVVGVDPASQIVSVGGNLFAQGSLGAAFQASANASANAAADAASSAASIFGTDSVAEQIEYGFAGDVGTLPPIDHRLQGVGISVPKCFNESREGEPC